MNHRNYPDRKGFQINKPNYLNGLLFYYSTCEERVERTVEELKEATSRADEAERRANALESRGRTGEDKIESLEEQLKVCVTERSFSN